MVPLVGLCVVGAFHRADTAIPPGFAGRHVSVSLPAPGGEVPLRVHQAGNGRDVLLIHGSPGSVEDWEPVMSAMDGTFHLTAYDRPGHGFSGDTGAYSLEHNAQVAIALIDALKLEHVVVVGHSYGGATALAMALHGPPAVDAYVIIDSATYTPSRKADFTLRILDVPLLGYGLGTIGAGWMAPKKIRKGLIDVFGGRTPPEDFVTLRTRIWSSPKVTHAIAEETLGAEEELRSLSGRYRSIQSPVYIVAEADSEFRRHTAARLHGEIEGSSLELLPGAGHYLQFEKTAEVVATIRRAAAEH